MRRTKDAFLWITSVLEEERIPYQISGGFAARLYGSARRLADIDIDIPRTSFARLMRRVMPYVTMKPHQWKGEGFECYLMCLRYKGQDMDVSAYEGQFIWDKHAQRYLRLPRPKHSTLLRVYGKTVPVIPKEELIAYKRILSRPVDVRDIAGIS